MRQRIALSQNFLRRPRLAELLLDRAAIGTDDVVYEIGPGGGILTERLARRCRHVIAVEKDPGLAERLRRRVGGRSNVSLFMGDFLAFPLPITPYKVFANLPFNGTAAIVERLTTATLPPHDAYLVVQREAAARFLGRSEGAAETLAAVLLKPWFEPTVVHRFERADFTPAPAVDVVMLRLRKRGPPLIGPGEAQRYRDFVTHAFVAWQPTVGRAVASILGPEQRRARAAPPPGQPSLAAAWARKPSEVSFDTWLDLYRGFAGIADGATWTRVSGAEQQLRRQQSRLQKMYRTRVRPLPDRCGASPAAGHLA